MSTATVNNPYRVAAGEGLANVWWKNGRMTIKAGGAETGGAFALLETDDPRGAAPPLHVHHNEDEAFYVLDGEVTILVGNDRVDLVAGDFCYAPREIPHTYIVRSERARVLTTLSPAGLEELFASLGVPVTDAPPPTEAVLPPFPELARLFGGYGCEILGPPPTLADLD